MEDKFERSGLHAVKSGRVDAPVVEEFPLTLECKVVECQHTAYGFRVLGEIVNVLADEKVLDEKGKVIPEKLNAFVFDQCRSGYYAVGEKVGQAWQTGCKTDAQIIYNSLRSLNLEFRLLFANSQ